MTRSSEGMLVDVQPYELWVGQRFVWKGATYTTQGVTTSKRRGVTTVYTKEGDKLAIPYNQRVRVADEEVGWDNHEAPPSNDA